MATKHTIVVTVDAEPKPGLEMQAVLAEFIALYGIKQVAEAMVEACYITLDDGVQEMMLHDVACALGEAISPDVEAAA